MAAKRLPKELSKEAERLFVEYITQKKGSFSHEDMIEYVKKHCSKELLPYVVESGTELVK